MKNICIIIHKLLSLFLKREKSILYVGCSLTHAEPEFISSVKAFIGALEIHCIVLKFVGLTDGTNRDVWIRDINECVKECDLMIAVTDKASTGLGVEMGTAVTIRTPVIAVALHDSLVTRLVSDPPIRDYVFVRHSGLVEEVLHAVVLRLDEMSDVTTYWGRKAIRIRIRRKLRNMVNGFLHLFNRPEKTA